MEEESATDSCGAHGWRRGVRCRLWFLLQMCLLFLLSATRQIYVRAGRRRVLDRSVLDLTMADTQPVHVVYFPEILFYIL